MERNINNRKIHPKQGKTAGFIGLLILMITSLTVSSCSAIGEIFKAGMGFGIFIVVAVIVIVILLVMKFGKGKNS
jgi:hypothetical protein